MPREEYQTQLATLGENVRSMGEAVTNRLDTSIEALVRSDTELAQQVVEGDSAVNETYLELEGQCVDLLALQQPVAGDLRFVIASFKIITDLERIGDLATNLGEYTLEADREAFPAVDLRGIGAVASEMVTEAMAAYEAEDAWACHEVAALDDELDELCERASTVVVRELLETDTPGRTETDHLMEEVFWLSLAIRDLERVGDHAVNISARTLYMTDSDPALIY